MSTELATAAKADDLAADVRAATRDLILVLADSKRLLGTRYAGWILGAPELEAGIACASMAQDEWGHSRLLYALLRDFGDDVDGLEHTREPAQYASMQALDRAPASWPELIAVNVFADGALTVQLEALRGSSFAPLRQRVEKLLEEERFHSAHGTAWFRRMAAANPDARAELDAGTAGVLAQVLPWFGPDSEAARAMQAAGIIDAVGSGLRARFLERVAPLLALVDAGSALGSIEPDFGAFDESTRRAHGTAPDATTIAQVRGDKNRAFLMD